GRPIPGDAHQSPSDWEFYANGRIEGKLAPKISTAHERWLKRRGLDRLTGPGAWADYEQVPAPLRGLRKMEAVGGEK
ncbi:MAG: hypothetical protein OER86_13550, partial [Phycisphaerae bacterium]|nr:hypothetical protein [Phycisphaerae bacterium]